ncbi:hypothetical protein EMCG_01507 [[Emmonsia] crescens]|uniref:Uncharacterized protein n=1 Tax=[Emmonsia] crescens TaxID=73230 RepID=A0A0G2J2J4_9EURO|nr:hypothetical protein EMCG_01507 [Emmonsia crescens UAMH 3008]
MSYLLMWGVGGREHFSVLDSPPCFDQYLSRMGNTKPIRDHEIAGRKAQPDTLNGVSKDSHPSIGWVHNSPLPIISFFMCAMRAENSKFVDLLEPPVEPRESAVEIKPPSGRSDTFLFLNPLELLTRQTIGVLKSVKEDSSHHLEYRRGTGAVHRSHTSAR